MVKSRAHGENHEKMGIFGRISSFSNCSTTFIPLSFVLSDRDRPATSIIKVWLWFRTSFRIKSATNDPMDWKWTVLDPLFRHFLSDSSFFLKSTVRFVYSLTFLIVQNTICGNGKSPRCARVEKLIFGPIKWSILVTQGTGLVSSHIDILTQEARLYNWI
jgi:hypothetical protein